MDCWGGASERAEGAIPFPTENPHQERSCAELGGAVGINQTMHTPANVGR